MVLQQGVEDVAQALGESGAPIVRRLVGTGNPRGSGVVVYVKPTSGCEPEFLWLVNNSAILALDDASHALTPGAISLADASSVLRRSIGVGQDAFDREIRRHICSL